MSAPVKAEGQANVQQHQQPATRPAYPQQPVQMFGRPMMVPQQHPMAAMQMQGSVYQFHGPPHMNSMNAMMMPCTMSDASRLLAVDKQKAKNEYKAPWTPEVPPPLPRTDPWMGIVTLSVRTTTQVERHVFDRDVGARLLASSTKRPRRLGAV